jgi:hypothetical protein
VNVKPSFTSPPLKPKALLIEYSMEKNHQGVMDHGPDDIKPKHELDEYIEGGGTSAESAEFKIKEAKLRRKLDLFIAPVMMMLMLISYLDRGNIGFAATQGMSADIGLKGNQLNVSQRATGNYDRDHLHHFQTAVSIFYIFYILAEFPTSIFVKRLQFNRVIPAICASWGLVCLCRYSTIQISLRNANWFLRHGFHSELRRSLCL